MLSWLRTQHLAAGHRIPGPEVRGGGLGLEGTGGADGMQDRCVVQVGETVTVRTFPQAAFVADWRGGRSVDWLIV